ncbi:High mobility group B protein 3 [Zostera marina]|uniref:High mobility group B protein 3 n=1 Tax=Zostera marina TaxID=29655 RepID=A0A0K9PI65_ZOSMR|nr:High mobility group B protein 3 [Zostera marina]
MKGGGGSKVSGRTTTTTSKRKAPEKAMSRAAKKAAKDPNMPKRPPSAFFVFMEDFRIEFKKNNPNNKSVAAVGKAGGTEWKSLTDDEKAPFIATAEKRKAEYTKQMTAYNNKTNGGNTADEEEEVISDKSKSDVQDDDDEDDDGSAEGEN